MPTQDHHRAAGAGGRSRFIRDRRDRALLRRYARNRDPGLREQLIERFIPLARSLAWRYQTSGEPIEDLVQVACEGLVRAIDGYEPDREIRFSSYATPMILGTLRHHFRDETQAVHMPRGLAERIQKVRTASEQLGTDAEGNGAVPRLAELTGLGEDEIDEALEADAKRRPLSVDRTIGGIEDGESRPLLEAIGASDRGFDEVEAALAAESAPLEERERSVLGLRFGRDMSQREVGEELGVSQMQVSRVQRRALRKLLDAVRGRDPQAENTVSEEMR